MIRSMQRHRVCVPASFLLVFMLCSLILLLNPSISGAAETYNFAAKWPSPVWSFSSPYDMAVDPDGNVYVADTHNHRIQKFSADGAFVATWGRNGSGDGEFDYPEGIAIDSAGNVYVAESGNHRIQKFTSDGTFITKWGSYGTADGQFFYPGGIAVDSAGNVYVPESGNHRIQKFTSDGAFIAKWGGYGTGDGKLNTPEGLAVDSDSNVYVAEAGNNRIQKFTSDGAFIAKWGGYGTGDGHFSSPQGVGVDSAGNVYVADRGNNRIQKFTDDGAFLTKWGSYGTGGGQFRNPQGVDVDNVGNVDVADLSNNRIQKFTAGGTLVAKWGNRGSDDGEFESVGAIAADSSGSVYVVDDENQRVQKFTYNGAFITKWGSYGSSDGQFNSPNGVAVDAFGNVYVSDFYNYRVQKFTADGAFITKWGSAGTGDGQLSGTGGIAVDRFGDVYVADRDNNRIQKFTADGAFITKWGSSGSGDGEFWWPSGIAVDSVGNVFVADSGNNRIQEFTSEGSYVTKWYGIDSGNGGFSDPRGVAVDSFGNVYVTEIYAGRIQKFSVDGAFVSQWGRTGAGDGDFSYPFGITLDPEGNVYVADSGNYRVQKLGLALTSPTTLVSVNPSAPDGDSNWFKTAPTITLAAREPGASIYYQWDSTSSGGWLDYSGPINAPEGAHKIYYRSIDSLGNVEPPQGGHLVKVDTQPPITSISTVPAAPDGENGWFKLTPKITLSANDPGVIYYQWDSTAADGWTEYPGSLYGLEGRHTLYYYSVDVAGQVGDTSSQEFSVSAPSETYLFDAKWPSPAWHFQSPYGAAVDAAGNVYVADNDRIQKFTADGTLITKWGTSGSGDGQFSYPMSIAFDAAGNVYVADTYNHRIQKFTADGAFITKWGSYGDGDGQFNWPREIAVDAAGNVYVVESGNHRIQKFTADGAFITKWGSFGDGDGQFNYPEGIAVDAPGNVYVVEHGNHRIQKFTSDGVFVTKWGSYGDGDGQFSSPYGIAVDSSGDVYVADTVNYRIQKFTSDGAFVTKWGSYGTGDGQLSTVDGLTVDQAGNVYVADTGNNRIQKFAAAGTLIAKWGVGGSGAGEFNGPQTVAVDAAGNAYVADTYNHRIQKFTDDGTFVRSWGSYGSANGQFDAPYGIAVDPAGNVYVADTWNHRVQKFSPDGTFISKWGRYGSGEGEFDYPEGIAVDSAGNVYVAESGNNRIQKFTLDGTFIAKWGTPGSGDGEFFYPGGIAVDSAGNVYVPESGNHRIQKFTSDGVFVTKWGSPGSGDGELFIPEGLAVDSAGNVYVVEAGNNRIQKFTTDGAFVTKWGGYGTGDGQFDTPQGVGVDSAGNVYVADSANHRIQKFSLSPVPGLRHPTPANVAATTVSDTELNLSWQDDAVSEEGFQVQRRTALSGVWEPIASVGADTTSYVDGGLAPSTAYHYRVKAYSWNMESSWSSVASATTHDPTLGGQVVSDEGRPLGNAMILAYRTDVYDSYWQRGQTGVFEAQWADHWTRTDENGNYTFTHQDLAAGAYKVRVVPPNGYLSEWWGDKSDYGDADLLDVGTYAQRADFTVTADTIPPSGAIAINNESATATFSEVSLRPEATDDNVGGAIEMRFRNEDVAVWSNWEPYRTAKNWMLRGGAGEHTVWAQFKDSAGNLSTPVSDSIVLQPIVTNIDLGNSDSIQNGERVVTLFGGNRSFTISADVSVTAVSVVGVVPIAGVPTTITLSNVPAGSNHWAAPVANVTRGDITLIVESPEQGRLEQVIGRIQLIDPSGYVTDQFTGAPIEGAVVTLHRLNPETGEFEFLDPAVGSNSMLMQPFANPQYTLSDGYYGWDVAPGTYYVSVQKGGYFEIVESRGATVPPPVTDLDVQLKENQPPTAPVLSGAAASSNEIALSWTESADIGSGVAGYKVFNAETDELLAETSRTTHTFGDLEPGAGYHYYVKAYDLADNYSGASNAISVRTVIPTRLNYTGDVTGDYSGLVRLKASLIDENGLPLMGKTIRFALGGQEVTAETDILGGAETLVKLDQPAGAKTLDISFAGDSEHLPSMMTSVFDIRRETLTASYQGDAITQRHHTVILKAQLAETDTPVGDLSGRIITFVIDSSLTAQTAIAVTDASGQATTTATVDLPADVYKVRAVFAGDENYLPANSAGSPYVVWEPIVGLSAKGSGKLNKVGSKETEFGFNVKYTNESPYPKGKLEYEEEFIGANGKKQEIEFEGEWIDWLLVSGNMTIFEGRGRFEHQADIHVFRVIAIDNGKPGAGVDSFELYVDGLPFASGTLTKGDIIVKK